MKKYALMQAPIAENEYSAQITLVDTSTHEGKRGIENLRSNGYLHVGWIESDYSPRQLNAGFEYDCRISQRKIQKISARIPKKPLS